MADTNEVKVRLGQINAAGEQKGVDALIVTDLADLARNQAMSDAVLVSGDEDVHVGVVLAQQFGVRVHLLEIEPSGTNQSRSLRQEADTTMEWNRSVIASFLNHTTSSASVTPPTPNTPGLVSALAISAVSAGLEAAVLGFILELSAAHVADLKALFATSANVPQEHDKALLRIGRTHHMQATLTGPERAALRTTFVSLILRQP